MNKNIHMTDSGMMLDDLIEVADMVEADTNDRGEKRKRGKEGGGGNSIGDYLNAVKQMEENEKKFQQMNKSDLNPEYKKVKSNRRNDISIDEIRGRKDFVDDEDEGEIDEVQERKKMRDMAQ